MAMLQTMRELLAHNPHPNAWIEIVSQRDGTIDILLRHGALVMSRGRVAAFGGDMDMAVALIEMCNGLDGAKV